MIKELFQSVKEEDKTASIEALFSHSVPSKDFYLMITLSVLMASFGLMTNSPAVLIGSMLIAPMLYPILSLSMGIVMSEYNIVSKSFNTILKSSILTIGVSAVMTWLFWRSGSDFTSEILARTEPSLLYAAVGLISGFAASFALVKPKMNESLPGVAVSVALVPPLAVVGFGLARFNPEIFFSALLLFLINLAGVIFSAVVVFSMMNFYAKRKEAMVVSKEEEKKVEKEEEKVAKEIEKEKEEEGDK